MKRKIHKQLLSARQAIFALALIVSSAALFAQTTYTFNYTGSQQTIALQAGTYTIQTWGANGGDNLGNGSSTFLQNGGKGGYSVGTYIITSPTTVYVNVGGKGGNSTSSLNATVTGGYNGGGYGSANSTSGKSSGAGGGGGSHVATVTGVLSTLSTNTPAVLIVGGGGGAGECNYVNTNTQYNSNGGNGGGTSGVQNPSTSYLGRQGQGGTQTAGGGGGDNASATAGVPLQGIFGAGGYNPTAGVNTSAGGSGAGGGGGGWYGGGAGWVATGTAYQSGSGGGGSGFIGGVTNGTTIVFGQVGYVTNPDLVGDGRIHITELCSIVIYASGSNSLNPAICSGQSVTLTTNAVSGYSWSTGQTTSSIVVAPSTNTVYTLVATSSLNCSSSGTRSVSVNGTAPVLSISNPSVNICLGQTTMLTASGALSYTWANVGVVNGQTFTPTSTQVYSVSGQNGCGITTATTSIGVAPLPVSVVASPSLVCQGYATTLTAVASVGNYTWLPGSLVGNTVAVSPTASVLYTVTASDGTCSGTQTLQVNTKQTPTITLSSTFSAICQGDAVTFNANGAGTGGTYSWSTVGGSAQSITMSPSSNTLVVVWGTNTLNCTSSASQPLIVDLPPPLTISSNKTLTCQNAQVNLSASGAGFYNWVSGPTTSGYTVFPSGALTVYTVIGSHSTNTCTATRTIAIAAVIPSVTVTTPISMCEGKTATLIAIGATTYTWAGIPVGTSGQLPVQPASTTVYSLVASTQSLSVNCITNHTALVTVNMNPTITVTVKRNVICKGETNTLTAVGAANYTWQATLGTSSAVVVNPTSTTIYSLSGTSALGCTAGAQITAVVNSCNGVEEYSGKSLIKVYPNPNNGVFTVSTDSAITLNLTNALGQVIRTIELNEENGLKVEVNGLAKGVYYLSSGSVLNQSNYTKLIVN